MHWQSTWRAVWLCGCNIEQYLCQSGCWKCRGNEPTVQSASTFRLNRPESTVQVQKLKLDTESAMLEMDQVSSAAADIQLLDLVFSPDPVAPGTAAAVLVLCSNDGLTHGGLLYCRSC